MNVFIPEASVSNILNVHLAFSSADPLVVISVANINSLIERKRVNGMAEIYNIKNANYTGIVD